jgi:hypothetical protein
MLPVKLVVDVKALIDEKGTRIMISLYSEICLANMQPRWRHKLVILPR